MKRADVETVSGAVLLRDMSSYERPGMRMVFFARKSG